MSALPPKADMCSALGYVRFVPEADIEEFGSHQKKNLGHARGFAISELALLYCEPNR